MLPESWRKWSKLFLVSFAALFFEVLIIRWCSAEIIALAHFKNIVLMAAVVGLGLGCACWSPDTTGKRKVHPPIMFAIAFTVLAGILFLSPGLNLTNLSFATTAVEGMKIMPLSDFDFAMNLGKLTAIFLLIVMVFDALGRQLGKELAEHDSLAAYGVNLAGSLAGVVGFSLCSFLQTPPVAWVVVGMASLAIFYWDSLKARATFAIALVASCLFAFGSAGASIWSPYYRIDHEPYMVGANASYKFGEIINVNHVFHQRLVNLSDKEIAQTPWLKDTPEYLNYNLPYQFVPHPKRVLIMGAGTGNDVASALRHGAEWVDAVEIDPAIQKLGVGMHPEQPYADPRVHVHITDARAFLESEKSKYDLIVFAYLDSHTAFSVASSVRLDHYLYTKESVTSANAHLAPDGVAVLSFGAGPSWLRARFYKLAEAVSAAPPVVLDTGFDLTGISIFWGKDTAALRTRAAELYPKMLLENASIDKQVELPTDNWPFLYQESRTIPPIYPTVLGLLVLVSVVMILGRMRLQTGDVISNLQFLMLGAGFLLMETRGMLAAAILFGSTWLVNSIVIGILLLMAIIGNLLVMRFPKLQNGRIAYLGIFAGLTLLYVCNLTAVASQPMLVKVVAATVLLGLPFLSSGIVFSSAFKKTQSPQAALGINILGAIIGCCLEYGSLVVGSNGLLILAGIVYSIALAASFGKRGTAPALVPQVAE